MRTAAGQKRSLRSGLSALALFFGLAVAAPGVAHAQFGFFGLGDASVQDVYDTIAESGFRLAGPLARNGSVWVADVFDRRNRRERLIISARDATIVQRYLVELGNERRSPYAPQDPNQFARRPRDDSFLSRMTRGFEDDAPPRPPAGIGNADPGFDPGLVPRPVAPPRVRQRPIDPEPRLANRKEEAPVVANPIPAPAPVVSSPVAPPQPSAPRPSVVKLTPATPNAEETPAPAAISKPPAPPAPNPAIPAASGARPVVVVTDPLRIPGRTAAPEEKAASAGPKDSPTPATKPASKPATGDVPVAPLD